MPLKYSMQRLLQSHQRSDHPATLAPFYAGFLIGLSTIYLIGRWNRRLSIVINLIDIIFSLRSDTLHLKDSDTEGIDAKRKRHTSLPIGPILPVKRKEDIAIPSAAGRCIPGLVYYPETAAPNCPIIVYIHGGGFVLGNAKFYEPVTTYLANNTNSIVVAIDYRKAPEYKFPCAPQDCLDAVRWIHGHAKEMGGDPDKIAVMGDSAGGNLSIIVSIELWDIVSMVIPIYPVVNFAVFSESKVTNAYAPILKARDMDWYTLRYFKSAADMLDPLANPLVRPDEELCRVPYTHVITAEFDVLLDEGREYVARLRNAGCKKVTYTHYENTVHGFFGAKIITHGTAAMRNVCDLINNHFCTI